MQIKLQKMRFLLCFLSLSTFAHAMQNILNPEASFVRKAKRKLYEHLGVVQRHAESGCRLVCTEISDPTFNCVLDFPNTEGQLILHMLSIKKFFTSRNLPFRWNMAQYLEPSNLGSSFLRCGINLKSTSPGLLIDPQKVFKTRESDQRGTIKQVKTDGELLQWIPILQESFGFSETAARTYISLFRSPGQDPDFTHFVCMVNNEMVSIGTLLATERGGYIYNIATGRAYRKNGYASAIVQKLLEVAKQKGLSRVGLIASQEAASLYVKLGFRNVCTINTYE